MGRNQSKIVATRNSSVIYLTESRFLRNVLKSEANVQTFSTSIPISWDSKYELLYSIIRVPMPTNAPLLGHGLCITRGTQGRKIQAFTVRRFGLGCAHSWDKMQAGETRTCSYCPQHRPVGRSCRVLLFLHDDKTTNTGVSNHPQASTLYSVRTEYTSTPYSCRGTLLQLGLRWQEEYSGDSPFAATEGNYKLAHQGSEI